MKPPLCFVCLRDVGDHGALVRFADHEPLPDGTVGHPKGLEWVCGRHLAAARARAHLPAQQALKTL